MSKVGNFEFGVWHATRQDWRSAYQHFLCAVEKEQCLRSRYFLATCLLWGMNAVAIDSRSAAAHLHYAASRGCERSKGLYAELLFAGRGVVRNIFAARILLSLSLSHFLSLSL